jgi:hypothetical protein
LKGYWNYPEAGFGLGRLKEEMSEISEPLRAAEIRCPKNAPWPGRTPYSGRTLAGVSLQKG